MLYLDKPISLNKLVHIAQNNFHYLVKAVVDVSKEVLVIDADLHSDEEAYLISRGSKQSDLWGINLYPELKGQDFIEFDSMINVRPNANNFSRGIDDENIRSRIISIVSRLIR